MTQLALIYKTIFCLIIWNGIVVFSFLFLFFSCCFLLRISGEELKKIEKIKIK